MPYSRYASHQWRGRSQFYSPRILSNSQRICPNTSPACHDVRDIKKGAALYYIYAQPFDAGLVTHRINSISLSHFVIAIEAPFPLRQRAAIAIVTGTVDYCVWAVAHKSWDYCPISVCLPYFFLTIFLFHKHELCFVFQYVFWFYSMAPTRMLESPLSTEQRALSY